MTSHRHSMLPLLLVPSALHGQVPARPPQPVRPPLMAPSPRPGAPVMSPSDQARLADLMAQHHRVKARLSPEEQADLDRLTATVKRQLFARPLPLNLLLAVTNRVSGDIAGLAPQEAASLGEYVLGGIAAGGALGQGTSTVGGMAVGTGSAAIGAAAGHGSSQQSLLNATKQMQEMQMSFNLQYLQLQSQMQNENRSYTAVSNIMKTKHDTVKNSISNIR